MNNLTVEELGKELEMAYTLLSSYKETVLQLSFDLEMSKENPNTFANITAIRRIALEQAANYVMDWGVPKSGDDLVKLCEKIKSLHETQVAAVARGLAAIGINFKDKS